jgi:hypothetical protein
MSAAPRTIELEVEGVTAVAELLDDVSPEAAEAFWSSLPLDVRILQTKWAGAAVYFRPPPSAVAAVKELENPVCSIYPGTLVYSPDGGELLIAHAASEYRRHVGTDYVSRIAEIVENRAPFLAVLSRMRDEGAKHLSIRRRG